MKKVLVIGGAGFIGSYCCRHLLAHTDHIVIAYDNFSSGRHWHVQDFLDYKRFQIVEDDAANFSALKAAMEGCFAVYHFASNPDIAKAATMPTIDFFQGTLLSQNVFEAARLCGLEFVVYTSGSGVYGENPQKIFTEDDFCSAPTSTYAASKIAGETLLSAYCHMFGLKGISFRMANVIGPHQTHGVAYDFINRLLQDSSRLQILGNGSQRKSYIYITDVIRAITFFHHQLVPKYDVFNVTTDDQLTVAEIAEMVIRNMELSDVITEWGSQDRGWVGDVPIIQFSAEKLHRFGWKPQYTSREAMQLSIEQMLVTARKDKFFPANLSHG